MPSLRHFLDEDPLHHIQGVEVQPPPGFLYQGPNSLRRAEDLPHRAVLREPAPIFAPVLHQLPERR